MSMRNTVVVLIFVAVIVTSCSTRTEKAAAVKSANGLEVVMQPVPGVDKVAMVVLYDVGSDHDPAGKSGMAHLIEHCYVTAAAGGIKARDMQEYVRRYPAGWNAQTGARFTVVATVFPAEDLRKELADAAARMKDLKVAQSDLDREKPRIEKELSNMFEGIPQIAAPNRAREKVLPAPKGGRKGGLPEQVNKITLDEIKKRLAKYYKPANAMLVLAGGFETEGAGKLVKKYFDPIPCGTKIYAPSEPGEPKEGGVEVVKVKPLSPQMKSTVSVAFRVPQPTDELYTAFLVALTRLLSNAGKLGAGPGAVPVRYAVLDDPDVVSVSAALNDGETPEKAVGRIRTFVADCMKKPFAGSEAAAARNTFGFFLGMTPVTRGFQNVYGLAFAEGRRRRMGVDPDKLGRAFDSLTEKKFRRATAQYFGQSRGAAVAVQTGK